MAAVSRSRNAWPGTQTRKSPAYYDRRNDDVSFDEVEQIGILRFPAKGGKPIGIRIRDSKHYRAEFLGDAKRKAAYELALGIRQFEIELYWKRATYFWTLIAATFGGYFAIASSEHSASHRGLIFLASCIGLVLATGWYLVNRGSKYWQANWERHVDLLEDELAGSPLQDDHFKPTVLLA
jgi:hypothetical protein